MEERLAFFGGICAGNLLGSVVFNISIHRVDAFFLLLIDLAVTILWFKIKKYISTHTDISSK